MPTPAEFLKSLGDGFAPFDRPLVAKIGCLTALGLVGALVVAGLAGFINIAPFFPRFFRIIVLTLLGGALLVFVFFAAAETVVEKRARRRIAEYVQGGGADIETLLEMARMRQGRFAGSDRVIEILERAGAEKSA